MFYALPANTYKTLPVYPSITYGLAPSPYGDMAVAWWADAETGDKICYLGLHNDLQKITEHLHGRFPRNALVQNDTRVKAFAKTFNLKDKRPSVLMTGTPFFLQVWETLYQTPPGQTLSYGALAAQAGRPNARRAVGTAMSSNPIALIVPCHRVVASSGMGGYAYGLKLKERLLADEKF